MKYESFFFLKTGPPDRLATSGSLTGEQCGEVWRWRAYHTQLYSVEGRRRCHNKEYYSGYEMPHTPQKSEHQALQFQALVGGAPLSGWLEGGMPDMNPILPLFQPTTSNSTD